MSVKIKENSKKCGHGRKIDVAHSLPVLIRLRQATEGNQFSFLKYPKQRQKFTKNGHSRSTDRSINRIAENSLFTEL